MKQITFATGNPRKVREAREACDPLGITIVSQSLDIDEIQAHNPIKITEHKVNQAFTLLGEPVVVNDASWSIPSLNGFPGGYMKDVAEWFTPKDFISLINQYENREIKLIECIFYKDSHQTKSFLREFIGEIAIEPRGEGGNSVEKVAIFNTKTIAEHHNNGNMAFEAKDYIWLDFAKWYSSL